jgi:hypothetical protein
MIREECFGTKVRLTDERLAHVLDHTITHTSSFRQGMAESRAHGRDPFGHPWRLDSGNPCRNDGHTGIYG